MVGLRSVLAHELGLTRLNMGETVPLILSGMGTALLIQPFLQPRLLRRFPLPLPWITLLVTGIQFGLMLQFIRLDQYGYLAAFGCLLGLVTMQCYLGMNFGGRASLLTGVVLSLIHI